MKTKLQIACLLSLLFFLLPEAKAVTIEEENAISGGFGFQEGLGDWTPGGFKWFNDYNRKLGQRVWLNFQLNAIIGDMDNRHCWRDERRHKDCYYGHWDGNGIDFVIGVKLSWYLSKLPIEIYTKLGGAADLLLLGFDYTGIAIGFRGGVGAHFFLLPNLGIGAEIITTFGPSFIADGPGVEFYGAVDFRVIGVEYRW
ncbi:MAG: hypothetical protein GY847_27235 [Proteobacteria bacterium]|nr:hypothetical protein [Pseudomonadota bacterium]